MNWIKLESMDDYPKKSGHYLFYNDEYDNYEVGLFDTIEQRAFGFSEYFSETHWCKIEPPKK